MTQLLDKFVKHYTSVSQKHKFRRLYEKSWNGISRLREVQAIKEYLLYPNVGVDFLNKNVATPLSNHEFDVKFCSIFCHQKPRVTRTKTSKQKNKGSTDKCEIGDLFVLFLLLDRNDALHYCAGSLFQAKLKSKLDSASQKALYDEDLDFLVPEYLATRLSPRSPYRKMPTLEQGRAKALRYMILNPTFSPNNVQARYSPWENDYQLRASTFLDGLLSGTDGLKIEQQSNPNGAWEMIASDLLFTALQVKSNRPPRGNTDALKVATSHFNSFLDYNNYSLQIEDHEPPSVPTMLAIVQANSSEEPRG
ncbi:hypothetical protein [Alteromonas macleodii]|uniref:hypothetical protein n=1 Tax=Alteromonas macleodii TaxID=28108 RepID=UPI003140B9F3